MRTYLCFLIALAIIGSTITKKGEGLKAAEDIPTTGLQIDDLESTDDLKVIEIMVPLVEVVLSESMPKVIASKIEADEQVKPNKKIDLDMISSQDAKDLNLSDKNVKDLEDAIVVIKELGTEMISDFNDVKPVKADKKETATKITDDKKKAEVKPVESKKAEVKPVDAKKAEVKPVEEKKADAEKVEAKPVDVKADAKKVEAKPVEVKADVKKVEAKFNQYNVEL